MRSENAGTGMASLFYLFFFPYVNGPYEEVHRILRDAFPTFFWRLRKRGRSHLELGVRILTEPGSYVRARYLSVRGNINISIETMRANG